MTVEIIFPKSSNNNPNQLACNSDFQHLPVAMHFPANPSNKGTNQALVDHSWASTMQDLKDQVPRHALDL